MCTSARRQNGGGPIYDPGLGDLQFSNSELSRQKDVDQLGEMVLSYDFGPATLTSVTGYVRKTQFRVSDLSGITTLFGIPQGLLPVYFPTDQFSRSWTQEVRLASNGDGPFNGSSAASTPTFAAPCSRRST